MTTTTTDYYGTDTAGRAALLATARNTHRATSSPFDEIARTNADGTLYWSARDLAKLFGYTDWRNFADAIRKARQQVAAHNIAGQGSFVDANKSIPTPKGNGHRFVPDVHLSRFACYFVALNADQSKPEVRAAVNYYFVGRTIQAEQMIAAADSDAMITADHAKRIADLELVMQGLPAAIGDAVAKALTATPSAPQVAATARKTGRPALPSLTAMESARYGKGNTNGSFARTLVRGGYLDRRTIAHRVDGNPIREYREASHIGMFRFRKHPGGPYTTAGRYVYVTEAGQRFLADTYGWDSPNAQVQA